MRIPRFSILQLLLAATLIALLFGLFTSAQREKRDDGASHFSFSPTGKRLAVLHGNGTVRVWQIDSARPRLIAQEFGERPRNMLEIEAMNFLDDNRILKVECAVNTGTTRVRELDLRTQRISEIMEMKTTLARWQDGQAASPERLVIADFNSGDLFSFDLGKHELERRLPCSSPNSWPALRLSTGGEILAATDQANTIHIFDAKGGQFLRRFPDRSGQIVNRSPGEPPGIMALNHDGTMLALPRRTTNSTGSEIVLFDPRSGAELDTLPLGLDETFAIAFSHDAERLAVSDGEAIECYERTSKKLIRRIALGEAQRAFMQDNSSPRLKAHYSQVALSPDGMMLAASGSPMSDQILLWNLSDGGLPRTIGTSDSRVASVGIFTVGFALWAAVWGIVRKRDRARSGFQPTKQTPFSPFWRRILIASGCLGVATILFVELTADDTFNQRELYFWLTSTQGYFSSLHLLALGSLPCLFLLLMVLRRNRTSATRCTAAGLSLPSSVPVQPRSPPWGLRLCWLLMVAGGLVALLIPVSTLLFSRSEVPWTSFVSLFVGIVTISRGGSGDTLGLMGVVGLQAINIIACDVLNFAFAATEYLLLRGLRVRQFLEQTDRDGADEKVELA